MEQFTFVKRGYDPEEVDKYITTLEQVIKSYKDKDNAIKNSIISAQRTAEDVIKNAHAEAESYKTQMGEQLVGMRGTLDRQRSSLQNFEKVKNNAIRKCIQELELFDMNEMFTRIDEMDAAIAALQGLGAINKDRLMQSHQGIDTGGMMREPQPDTNPMPMRDTGREAMRPQPGPDPYAALRETRDVPREMPRELPREIPRDMRSPGMELPARDIVRDTGMEMMRTRPPAPPMPREPMREPQPYAPSHDHARDNMMPRESYAPQPVRDNMAPREEMQQPYMGAGRDMMMRDDSREMMRPPAPMRAPRRRPSQRFRGGPPGRS